MDVSLTNEELVTLGVLLFAISPAFWALWILHGPYPKGAQKDPDRD